MKNCGPQKRYLCSKLRKSSRLNAVIVACLTPGLLFFAVPLQANPSGGVVVHGDINIGAGTGGNLQIDQNSLRGIINWDDFSINAGELTQFNQSSINAAVLNRVTGGNPSEIHGALQANGSVFVINPNGILVGATGTIDVHGLVLSTLDISNGEFLAGGDMVFKGDGEGVTNMGRINAIGGDVFLIGKTVTNSGSITASGTVGLGAGEEILLTASETSTGERMFIRSTGAGASGTGVLNDGTIEGAAIELKAHGNMYALAINNKGSVRATGAVNSGGRVYLKGVGGTVGNSGSIRASSPGAGNAGRILIEAAYAKVDGILRAEAGNVSIAATQSADLGGSIDLSSALGNGGDLTVEGSAISLSSNSAINASGQTGGGSIQIGGGFQGKNADLANAETLSVEEGSTITADSLETGNGGVVILWADDSTLFRGDISARGVAGNGGFAEVSGKNTLGFQGSVDLGSDSGSAGLLLLDPTDVTISSAIGAVDNVNNVDLSNTLDTGTDVIITSSFGGAGPNGDITVNDRVEWYQDSAVTPGGTLTLLATGDVIINDSVRSAGEGGINIVAGWDDVGGVGLPSPLDADAQTDGIAFDMQAVLDTMTGGASEGDADAAGNANGTATGSIFIGNNAANVQINVGSRFGDTLVAAHDLIMQGDANTNEAFVQLGFTDNGTEFQISNGIPASINNSLVNEWWGSDGSASGTDDATVTRNVTGKNYIALLGGTEFSGTGDAAFLGAGSGADGNIEARLSGRLDMKAGTTRGYVQIGHGGSGQEGIEDRTRTQDEITTTRDGFTLETRNNRQIFASSWKTNTETDPLNGDTYRVNGDITIEAEGDVLLLAAPALSTDSNNTANGNTGTANYAMIGHGGAENFGSFHGNVSVIAHGAVGDGDQGDVATVSRLAGIGIDIVGGLGTTSFAQIGHGGSGEGTPSSVFDQQRSGDITVTAEGGAIRMQGYEQPLTLSRNDSYSGVKIGHGGAYAEAPRNDGAFTGNTLVPDVSGIRPDNSSDGNITVLANGTYVDPNDAASLIGIGVRAGNSRYASGQIGHGGANLRADTGDGYQGDIDVRAPLGDIIFQGAADILSSRDFGFGRNQVMIGHGGRDVDGLKGGLITVLAGQGVGATDGDIRFSAGKHFESFAQIGHGGYTSSGGVNSLENEADIKVNAFGDISFVSGESGSTNAMLLSVGNANDYFNRVTAGSSFRTGVYAAQDRYVMIGHGGRDADGVIPNAQDIEVISGTGDVDNDDGDTTTGGVTFVSGDQDRDFAQLGHGGYSNGANNADGFSGDILVNAMGGSVIFDGSIEGGTRYESRTDGSLDGVATTRTVTALETGANAYIQIGHGGDASRGDHSGEISITSNGSVEMIGSINNPTFVQSYTAADDFAALEGAIGNPTGNVWVNLNPLVATASTRADAYNMALGPVNVKPGTLTITLSDGTVITDSPDFDSDELDSNIVDATGKVLGNINYQRGRIRFNTDAVGSGAGTVDSVEFTSIEGYKDNAYAQIGHGGRDADGPNNTTSDNHILPGNSGGITIEMVDELKLNAGAFYRNYAQIGHGGLDTKGQHSGEISITGIGGINAAGGIEVVAGNGGHRNFDRQAYAQIGHGGREADGTMSGNVTILAGETADGVGLLLKAGTKEDNYAQIGHGGYSARSGGLDGASSDGHSGDITIDTSGDINVIAGVLGKAATTDTQTDPTDGRLYAMIGHGGYDADANQAGATAAAGTEGHRGDIALISSAGSIFVGAGDFLRDTNASFGVDTDEIAGGRFGFAMVGHGGYASNGNHFGDITVHAGFNSAGLETDMAADVNGITVVGGMHTQDNSVERYSYAMIGHGGRSSTGNQGQADDVLSVMADGDISFTGGEGQENFVQLGNGARAARGDHQGNIQVIASGDINFTGGGPLRDGVDTFSAAYSGGSNRGNLSIDRAADTDLQATRGNGTNEGRVVGDVDLIHGRIEPGTLRFTTPDGVVVTDADGDGNLYVVSTGTFTSTELEKAGGTTALVVHGGAGATAVGSVNYANGRVSFDSEFDIDPNSDGGGTDPTYATRIIAQFDHAADADHAYAQLGNGGSESDGPNNNVTTGHSGNISVASLNGGIAFTGGQRDFTYAQIGHGGDSSDGSNTGDITVRSAQEIVFTGGDANRALAFLGHGGYENDADTTAGHSGVIKVSSGSGSLFTSLGDGMFDDLGDFNGDTVADVFTFGATDPGAGGLSLIGGTGAETLSMIGHGGRSSDGAHDGVVAVSSFGDISLLAGTGARAAAQIGHGGVRSNGNLSGDIHVIAEEGDILVDAGAGSEAYALIGHGDDRSTNQNNATGTRGGGIHVIADQITLDRNGNRTAWIGHSFDQNTGTNNNNPFVAANTDLRNVNLNGAASLSDVYIAGGYQVIALDGLIAKNNGADQAFDLTITDAYRDNIITPNIQFGDFALSAGNITVNSTMDSTTTFATAAARANYFSLFSTGNLDVNDSIINPGTGHINLVAGAQLGALSDSNLLVDAPSFGVDDYARIDHLYCPPAGRLNFNAVKGDGFTFGTSTGRVRIDAGINDAMAGDFLAVGSRDGETNVFGQSVILRGGDLAGNYAQIGFNSIAESTATFEDTTGDATGSIMVEAGTGGVSVRGGDINDTYAMIGHGGDDEVDPTGTTVDPNHSGMISVRADRVADGVNAGNISITGVAGDRWAMIGHGGEGVSGNHSGDIVLIGNDITMLAGNNQAFTQVGHGGLDADGNFSGDIYVNFDPDPDHDPMTDDGEIRGGTGAVTLNRSGNGSDSYLQIGHGGRNSDGSKDGDIFIAKAASVAVLGGGFVGAGSRNYAQIGHGGHNATGDIGTAVDGSDITIRVDGVAGSNSVTVSGGLNQEGYAQIGHGGDTTVAGGSGYFGNISVTAAAGDILVEANSADANGANRTFAMVGHGGLGVGGALNGDLVGDIELTTGDGGITLDSSAEGNNNIVQVGHGGLNVDALNGFSGSIKVRATDDIIANAGTADNNTGADPLMPVYSGPRHVQIGHGGNGSNGNHGSATDVISVATTGGAITFTAGPQNDFYAMIGNGGVGGAGDHQADIEVLAANDITFTAGSGARAFAQIGNGGRTIGINGTDTGHVGDIFVASTAGAINFTAGLNTAPLLNVTNTESYAMIGNGGYNTDGDHTGDIVVRARGAIAFEGGEGFANFVQVGHGGQSSDASSGLLGGTSLFSGSITVQAGASGLITDFADFDMDTTADEIDFGAAGALGGISFKAGSGEDTYAQVGHGGRASISSASGDIDIDAAGAILLQGASGAANTANRSYAQFGHGGRDADPRSNFGYQGSVDVYTSVGDIDVTAGNSNTAHAQIGHGGRNEFTNDAIVAGGRFGTAFSGNISVITDDGNITLTGAPNGNAMAQIGHGGRNSAVAVANSLGQTGHTGSITVAANDTDGSGTDGDVILNAGGGADSAVMIGHGGRIDTAPAPAPAASGDHTASLIDVDAARNVEVNGGGARSFAMIGNGGENAIGNHSANITVDAATGGVTLSASSGGDSYAQIGSGGHLAAGSHTGNIEVNAATNIVVEAGTGTRAYAQIGNGGNLAGLAANTNDGTITVTSSGGSLELTGKGTTASAQIGHGGVNNKAATGASTTSATILVAINGGATLTSGTGDNSYAQIGHGGLNANANHLGDICVHMGDMLSLDALTNGATTGNNAFVQIGNGGYNSFGNHEGDITVVSGTTGSGGISLLGGGATGTVAGRSAQIGHGGGNAANQDVNLAGEIIVVSDNGGGLTMTGGAGNRGFAMVGHGDGHGTYGAEDSGITGGTRQGGIQYFVDDAYTFTAGAGANSNVYLHHRTNTDGGLNLTTPTYLGGEGFQFLVNDLGNSVDGTAGGAFEGASVMIGGNVGLGDVVVTFNGDLDINIPNSLVLDSVNHDFDFVVLATGNLNFNRNYQNAGTGDVALVAGWDGVQDPSSVTYVEVASELDFCQPVLSAGATDFDDKTSWGNRAGDTNAGTGASGGILTIGDAANTTSVAVGTQGGSTILRGYEIKVLGGASAGAFTQVGFITSGGNVTGGDPALASYRPSIDIQTLAGGLTVDGGEGTGAYAQIGHGGDSSTAAQIGNSFSADIVISFCEPGDLNVTAGGTGAYAQIGHGGDESAYTLIDGDITIEGTSNATLAGGDGSGAYSQVGHGGRDAEGNTSGNITLETAGLLSISGGGIQDAYAMVGHGGHEADGNHGTAMQFIDITANAIDMNGGGTAGASGGAFSQIGHGGHLTDGDFASNIYVNFDPLNPTAVPASTGTLTMDAGDETNDYVQIGHGGTNDGTGANSKDGDVIVNGFSAVTLTAGNDTGATDAFAQIGHGGDENDGDITGNVAVISSGRVTLNGGDGSDNYAQIGQGGHALTGNIGALDGSNATVVIGNGIELNGGSGERSYSQIGFGGDSGGTTVTGDTYVNFDPLITMAAAGGGAITMTGGTGAASRAAIGLGGVGSASADGDVTVYGSSLTMTAETNALGESSAAQIGHRGEGVDGDIFVEVDGAATMTGSGGFVSYASIGHADLDASGGATTGDIHLGVGGDLGLNSGAGMAANFASVGHYRNAAGTVTGDIFAYVNGSATLNAASAASTSSSSQIGHFGFDGQVDSTGYVTLNAADGVALTGSTAGSGAAQVGHSSLASGDLSGSVSVISTGAISLTGGATASSSAAIGHGLASASGSHTGGLNVYTDGSITLGDGASGAALVSHQSSGGSASVDYLASRGGDSGYSIVGLTGIDAADTLDQQTGAGGVISLTETIAKALEADNVTIASGGTTNDLVIGDGAQSVIYDSANNLSILSGGDLTINAGIQNIGAGAIGLLAGWNNSGSTAAIAPLAAGLHTNAMPVLGDLALPNFSSIDITGPVAASEFGVDNAVARIGDGTQITGISVGSRNGVTEILGDSIEVTGGAANDAFAQLGYFSPDATTDTTTIDGTLNLSSGAGGITVAGGSGENTFAQVGHGGILAGPAIDANISVRLTEAGALLVSGGSDEFAYGQFGHGGAGYVGDLAGSIVIDENVTTATVQGGDATNAYAQLGHGGAESEGSKTGAITLEAESVLVDGGSQGLASGQIGHGGNASTGTLEGALSVTSTVGDVTVTGGDLTGANGQIGHGGLEFQGAVNSQPLTVSSASNVVVSGGATTSGQIGHGGTRASGGPIFSDVTVTAQGDVTLTDGTDALAFAQIGNGGAISGGSQGGDITVTGANVSLTSTGTLPGAYSKIGHGDFYPGALAPFGGQGTRAGDIKVTSTGDVTLVKSLIGHGSAQSQTAIDPASSTQVKAGDNLIADANSQLNGGSEFRAYLDTRADNQIASGAEINGETWTGAPTEPSATQLDSEFTRFITGENPSSPLEHNEVFDSGPAPSNAAGFAFYYDTIAIGTPVVVDPGPGGGTDPLPGDGGGVGGGNALDLFTEASGEGGSEGGGRVIAAVGGSDALTPEDRLIRENQKKQEEFVTRFNNFIIRYEGFDQYSPSGDSIYSYILSNGRLLDSGLEADAEEEDALRRLRRTMQELQESRDAQEENAAQQQVSEDSDDIPLALR